MENCKHEWIISYTFKECQCLTCKKIIPFSFLQRCKKIIVKTGFCLMGDMINKPDIVLCPTQISELVKKCCK